MTPLSRRARFVLKWTYPPLGWGVGAALVSWLGVIELDVLTAFITGCIVGLVHDLALVAFGVGKWGDAWDDQIAKTNQDDS
jgi:hypothetical protein